MATRYLGTTVWGVALLAASLFVNACGEETPDPRDEDEENSNVGGDDDDDDDGRVDAGSGKGDGGKPRADASKPSKPPDDEGDDDDGTPPDQGDDDDEAPSTPGSDAGVQARDAGKDATVSPASDASTSESDGAVAGEKMDLGKGDGKDVITIGDSWMSLIGTGIQQSLVKVSGQKYRTYGVAGTRLLNEQIPNQYASAKRADPNIKTVVMTGGGNDILLTGADPKAQIPKIAKRLDELWAEMGKDGVLDVVYIEYSEGGNNGQNVRDGIAAVQPVCDNHKALRCHFMLSDPIIMKQLRDGIHPTDSGYDKLGKAVHELMIAEGMRR